MTTESYYLQITSGNGPVECSILVAKLVQFIMKDAATSNIKTKLMETISGDMPDTYFCVFKKDP